MMLKHVVSLYTNNTLSHSQTDSYQKTGKVLIYKEMVPSKMVILKIFKDGNSFFGLKKLLNVSVGGSETRDQTDCEQLLLISM